METVVAYAIVVIFSLATTLKDLIDSMEYNNVLTTCVYCGTGCGLHLQVLNGRVVGTLPAKGHPVSEEKLFEKRRINL